MLRLRPTFQTLLFDPTERVWPRCLAWSPDGRALAIGLSSGVVQVFWGDTNRQAYFPSHAANVTAIAWSPNGRFLASGSRDTTLCIRDFGDASDGRVAVVLREHQAEVTSLSWSPTSARLASGGRRERPLVWLVSAAALVAETRLLCRFPYRAYADLVLGPNPSWNRSLVAWAPKGGRVLHAYEWDPQAHLSLWSASPLCMTYTGDIALPNAHLVAALAWAPDGRRAAVGQDDGRVRIVKVGNDNDDDRGRVLCTLTSWARASARLAWSPDGRYVAGCGSQREFVAVWPVTVSDDDQESVTATEALAGPTDAFLEASVLDVAWAPTSDDVARVFTVSLDGQLRGWTVGPVAAATKKK